jgi:hypothetical protein
MRTPRQTRFDLSDPVQFKALVALLGREGAAEQASEGLRVLSRAAAGDTRVALQLRRSRSALEQEGSLRSQVLGAVDVLTRLGGRRVVMVYVFADTTGGKLWRRGLLDQVVTDAREGVMRELWHLDSKRLGRMPPRQVFAYLDALDAADVRARNLSCPNADDDFAGDIKRMVDAEQNHRELLDKAQSRSSGRCTVISSAVSTPARRPTRPPTRSAAPTCRTPRCGSSLDPSTSAGPSTSTRASSRATRRRCERSSRWSAWPSTSGSGSGASASG